MANLKFAQPYTAWLSLDAQDGEPARFLSYFIAALRTIYPDACPKTFQLLPSQELPLQQKLLALLVNEIDALNAVAANENTGHLVIVLDDFDAMQNDAANRLLHLLIQFPLPRLHLVLTCRRDPHLPLAQLHAQQKLLEIRSRDLRLTRAEIQEFVRQNFQDGGRGLDIDLLETRSEGWLAMLRLMSLVVRGDADGDLLTQLPDGHQDIARFFVEQVLERESNAMREALTRLAIPERFSADLCERLCDLPPVGGTELLNQLKAENLFVVGLDVQGIWFRFHHLFRQLLQQHLKLYYTYAEQADLHRRASAWFRENHEPEETIKHALAAGDVADAVAVFSGYRHALMDDDRWTHLDAVLRLFPASALETYPDLLLSQAWLAHTQRHDFLTLRRMVQETELRFRREKLSQKRLGELRAECIVRTAMRLFVRESDASGAIRLLQRAFQMLPRGHYHVRSIGWIVLSGAYQAVGESEPAYRVLQDALVEDISPNQVARANLL